MTITCLIPAAGASSRMRGADKLMQDVEGEPCVVALAKRALAAGLNVIVTLPSADHPRALALSGLPLLKLAVPDAGEGMSASLRAGARAMPDAATGLMILPADMPAITSADISKMRDVFTQTLPLILKARAASGKSGHPVIFAAKLRSDFEHLSGDAGAQSIVQRHKDRIAFVDFSDERPLSDLDTPEDWAAWRASLGRE
ncbi:MAG: nucleotidyltransferase family protein [Planktotalea sp.]|uniref:nucleotidyltransferase family protein n=1 Tax=Planktotalea sp. TaxID=2029877 RepID=UPI003C753B51